MDDPPAPASAVPPSAPAEQLPTEEPAPSLSAGELAKQHELTADQLNAIQADIAKTHPLISPPEPVRVLAPEYAQNPRVGFAQGLEDLQRRYANLRRVRGDGNCFYRCFLFGLLERLINSQTAGDAAHAAESELDRVLAVVRQSKEDLVAVGYEEVAIETFWEVLVDALEQVPNTTPENLLAQFQEEGGMAEYMVWFCRCLAAGHMKRYPDRFLPFIFSLDDAAGTAVVDVDQFCRQEVEPMGKECEQVQIIALCEALGVGVTIEYLDGAPLDGTPPRLSCVKIPTDLPSSITLLYRPGHYDLLYTPPP